MTKFEIIHLLLFWMVIFYAKWSGRSQGHMWLLRDGYDKADKIKDKNMHANILARRVLVVGTVIAVAFILTLHWSYFLTLVSIMLVYPYFHEGFMNCYMNTESGDKSKRLRWRNNSDNSNAKMNIPYKYRSVMFIAGWFIHVILISYSNEFVLPGIFFFIYTIFGFSFIYFDKKV